MDTNDNEIEMMLECAAKVKKHLTRVLEEKREISLRLKLNYVDELMTEADSIKEKIAYS